VSMCFGDLPHRLAPALRRALAACDPALLPTQLALSRTEVARGLNALAC
jgi:hypothetical protein